MKDGTKLNKYSFYKLFGMASVVGLGGTVDIISVTTDSLAGSDSILFGEVFRFGILTKKRPAIAGLSILSE